MQRFTTFEQLLEYQIKWYKEKNFINELTRDAPPIYVRPSWMSSISDSVNNESEILIRITKLGFLITNIYRGADKEGYKERAVLVGYMHKNKATEVCINLSLNNFLTSCITLGDYEFGNISKIQKTTFFVSMEDKGEDEVQEITKVGLTAHSDFIYSLNPILKYELIKEYSMVCFIDTTYGKKGSDRDGLFSYTERALSKLL